MRTLTGMGGTGSARELAEMLRQMGRGPDTMLAHITPDEAQMLLESGGSGRINPMTGLPEFQPEDYTGADYGFEMNQDPYDIGFGAGQFAPTGEPVDIRGMETDQFERFTGEQPMFTGAGSLAPQDFQPFDYSSAGFVPQIAPPPPPVTTPQDVYSITGRGFPQAAIPAESAVAAQPPGVPQQPAFSQRYPMLSRVLTAGLPSLPALIYAQQARREAGRSAGELRRLGQPLREQGEALRQQAISGGLTPSQARQQEARRAQLRQSASTRGATTGTQQAMIENTLARERAGLAESNLNNAIKQLNLANAYDEAAIRAKLQSDAQTATILASILGNITQSVAGTPMTQRQPTPQLTSPMPEQPVTRRAEVQ